MKVKATKFRSSIYQLLDRIEKTGESLEIERKGVLFKLEPVQKTSKLQRLTKKDVMNEDPQQFVSNDWSKEWNHDLP